MADLSFARAVAAVGGCTRALAGSRHADAPLLDRADAATLGALRAHGDRLAIRRRFHDPDVHRSHQPREPQLGQLFTALEDARLDALGMIWLAGIARNLLAHPGAGSGGLRWLAFECLSGRAAPRGTSERVEATRAELPLALGAGLKRLAGVVGEQEPFARAAAAWVRAAGPYLSPDAAGAPVDSADTPADRSIFRQLPRRGDPGGTAAPLAGRRDAAQDQTSDGHAGAGANVAGGSLEARYRAYTTAYDRVVNAAALASREELEQLRNALDADLSTIRSVVARMAKRLMRVLMARQTREWRFDLDEGILDGSRLAALVASRGTARPFKEESESRFPSTVVTLLIDHSGSMRGRPMRIAALTVEIFARVLERCGVRCEVLGFTTREWDGGEPAREWAARGYPEHPGRLNALEHIVVKSADVPWRRARAGLGLFLRDEMLKENIDGEAVQWAHARLLARPEPRRILIVVSDGTPMDEATMAANGHEYLERHLQEVIAQIESSSPVRLAAIGIGHDVSAFYRSATKIARVDDLGPALTDRLTALLDETPPDRARPR